MTTMTAATTGAVARRKLSSTDTRMDTVATAATTVRHTTSATRTDQRWHGKISRVTRSSTLTRAAGMTIRTTATAASMATRTSTNRNTLQVIATAIKQTLEGTVATNGRTPGR